MENDPRFLSIIKKLCDTDIVINGAHRRPNLEDIFAMQLLRSPYTIYLCLINLWSSSYTIYLSFIAYHRR